MKTLIAFIAGCVLATVGTVSAATEGNRISALGVTCGAQGSAMICVPSSGHGSYGVSMTRSQVLVLPREQGENRDGYAVFFRPANIIIYDMVREDILYKVNQP